MGQAAGTAAAMSVAENTTPAELNIKALQERLIEQNAILE